MQPRERRSRLPESPAALEHVEREAARASDRGAALGVRLPSVVPATDLRRASVTRGRWKERRSLGLLPRDARRR